VFVVLYAVALGLMLTNLGIIARQRIFLFPFLFVLLQGVPSSRSSAVGAGKVRLRAVLRPARPAVHQTS
jgi:hypothetical protein